MTAASLSPPDIGRSNRLALGFSCLGHTVMHIVAALYLTVVLAIERDWVADYDELIGLWVVGSLMIGVGAPLAGWLGDRWSAAGMMVIFFLMTGAGAIAAGFAAGPADLALALGLLGLGASIYHPVGIAWVVRVAVNRGRMTGINGIFGSLGVATAALIAGTISDAYGWRMAFLIPGVISILLGIALFLAIAAGSVVDQKTDARPQPPPGRGDMVRAFLILSVTMFTAGLVFNAVQTAMPKWFELSLDGLAGQLSASGSTASGSTASIGAMVTGVYLLAITSQYVGGWAADRYPLKVLYFGSLMTQVPLMLLASYLTGLPLIVVAIVMVYCSGFQIPAETLLLARFSPANYRGLMFGAKFVLAFGAGPLAVALVSGVFDRYQSFAPLFLLLGAVLSIAALAAVMLPAEAPAEAPTEANVPAEPETAGGLALAGGGD